MRRPEDEPEEQLRHQARHAALDLPPAPQRASMVPRWLALVVLVALLVAAAVSVWQLLSAPASPPGDAPPAGLERGAEPPA